MLTNFFSIGLRPFFFLSALSFVFFPMYIATFLFNNYPFPGQYLDIYRWHGHELLFGAIPALLTGFLLTASSNWTGRPPLKGVPLALLFIFWIFLRVLFFHQPSEIMLLIFGPLFLGLIIPILIIKLKGNRNLYPMATLLSLLFLAQILYLYGSLYLNDQLYHVGLILSSSAIYFFLLIFSGRLIPFFINSRFKKKLMTSSFKLESLLIGSSILYFINKAFVPSLSLTQVLLSLLILILFSYRSYKFYTPLIWKEGMIIPLYFAHLWFLIYFGLNIFEQLAPEHAISQPAIHALLTGALGMFAISIMSRASLGHTGRSIQLSPFLGLAFFCVFIGALMRVFWPLWAQNLNAPIAHVSMGLWTLGFVFFLLKFGPYYFKPRADLKN